MLENMKSNKNNVKKGYLLNKASHKFNNYFDKFNCKDSINAKLQNYLVYLQIARTYINIKKSYPSINETSGRVDAQLKMPDGLLNNVE